MQFRAIIAALFLAASVSAAPAPGLLPLPAIPNSANGELNIPNPGNDGIGNPDRFGNGDGKNIKHFGNKDAPWGQYAGRHDANHDGKNGKITNSGNGNTVTVPK